MARVFDTCCPETKTSFATIVSVAVAYFVTAEMTLFLTAENTGVIHVWPSSGIALAAALVLGFRVWPGIFAGAFLANIITLWSAPFPPAASVISSLTAALGNTLEPLAGAYCMKRISQNILPFNSIRDLSIFILMGGLAGPAISAAIGIAAFCLLRSNWADAELLWFTWWLGHAISILIITPVVLILHKLGWRAVSRLRLLEVIFVGLLLCVGISTVFWQFYPLGYLIIPLLLWAALFLRRFEAASAILFISAMVLLMNAHPIAGWPLPKSIVFLQAYIGVTAITALFLLVNIHSETTLRDMQRQLNDVIEFLPDATFVIDKDGKVILWNRAMELLTGIGKKDMLGKGDYAYSVPIFGEPRPILIDLVSMSDNAPQWASYDAIDRHGSALMAERYNPLLQCYLSGAASVLINADGKPYGAIESIRDISDRKVAEKKLHDYQEHLEDLVKERTASLEEANRRLTLEIEGRTRIEKALSRSEEKYRDLVESANSVIMRWKPDGTITFFNVFARSFFGYAEKEIIGRNIIGSIVPERETMGRDLTSLAADIVSRPEAYALNENENVRINGERVWLSWTNRPIVDEHGNVVEILSVGNDITPRKHSEEELRKTLIELERAKERAEAADQLKSAFLATMSHELRTPLNSIIGFTGIILQGLVGPLNDEQKKQMGMVKNSAHHLLTLINDVLDISKIEAGQLTVVPEPFDLRESLNRIVKTVQPLVEAKGLSLGLSVGPDVGMIRSDQRRVEQIMLNLIGNAIKFTERGRVDISGDVNGKAVRIAVSDSGIGIKADDMDALFKPFRQLEHGLTRRYEGTGLGLSICKKLVELLGGEISVSSAVGKGSTFSFTLPI
ncbi:MAG TPA: MASE1 domain-containing protein [Dissulfurispiraceae bacterium]|nr:MASE1 domain-containing protein [Dissulfurispiraceae bacterium]